LNNLEKDQEVQGGGVDWRKSFATLKRINGIEIKLHSIILSLIMITGLAIAYFIIVTSVFRNDAFSSENLVRLTTLFLLEFLMIWWVKWPFTELRKLRKERTLLLLSSAYIEKNDGHITPTMADKIWSQFLEE